jgi:Argininosuccinate lyase C-terminal
MRRPDCLRDHANAKTGCPAPGEQPAFMTALRWKASTAPRKRRQVAKTNQEKLMRLRFSRTAAALLLTAMTGSALAAPRDNFYWLSKINKASAVMIVERGIVPKALGARIYDAINRVDAAADGRGTIARLPESRAGSDGGRRARYQSPAFRPQPAGHRLDHAALEHADAVIRTMRFRPERALDEVNSDYSTTTELADTLQREADVPFRIGHHFASELVNYGRGHHLRASDIPYAEAQRIYADIAAQAKMETRLPLSEEQFRRSLTAENMVTASKGLGGPQPAEVARMLGEAKERLATDRAWLHATRSKLADAEQKLDQAFAGLTEGK